MYSLSPLPSNAWVSKVTQMAVAGIFSHELLDQLLEKADLANQRRDE